jgi:hypothetical protein
MGFYIYNGVFSTYPLRKLGRACAGPESAFAKAEVGEDGVFFDNQAQLARAAADLEEGATLLASQPRSKPHRLRRRASWPRRRGSDIAETQTTRLANKDFEPSGERQDGQ